MSVKGRIVVIDDEVNAAAALETLLKEDGYEVARAHDARTGLQHLEQSRARHRPHRPADAGDGRARAPRQDQGDPPRDHGHPDDRLRHRQDRGQGHEARGRGLPRQAHRRGGARGGPPEGPRAEGAPRGGPDPAEAPRAQVPLRQPGGREPRDAGGLQDDPPGGALVGLGAAPRRERHRQGAVRPGAPPEQPAAQQALHQGGLRGAARDAPRERAVRPREGLVHRRGVHAGRTLRGRRRGHALPRRDRRHHPDGAGEAAPLPRGAGVRARGRQPDLQGRRADRGRHPPGPQEEARGGRVPGGPLLPPQRDRDPDPAAARAARRHPAAGPPLPEEVRRGERQGHHGGLGRGPGAPPRPPLAGQRARARERHGAGGGPLQRAGPRPQPLPHPARGRGEAPAPATPGRGARGADPRAAPWPTSSARPSCAPSRRWAAAPRRPPRSSTSAPARSSTSSRSTSSRAWW